MKWINTICVLHLCIKLSCSQIGKTSVTFVIDDTSSMSEDIDEVKNGVTSIFDAVAKSNDSQVENFVLVTFNDHLVYGDPPECLVKTLDRDLFIRTLADIEVEGGGDCPEMALSGIEVALAESLPGSYIYVFTDAVAKDYYLSEKVQNLAIQKKAQIVFILTVPYFGCAYTYDLPGYLVYHQLADATSGQVFHMDKNDVGEILAYIKQTMEKRNDQFLKVTFPPGYGHELEIKVDGAMKDVMIAESGKKPEIELTAPDGTKPDIESVVDISEAKVVKVIDPKPGNYTAKVGSETKTSIVVSAETSVLFKHGFSVGVEPTTINEDTPAMPVAGVESYLAIQLVTKDDVILDTLDLVGLDGVNIINMPLKLINAEKKIYVSDKKFMPPDVLFKIAISGLHVMSDTRLTRLSRTPIEVQKILGTVKEKSLSMVIEEGLLVKVKYNDPLKLTCKVKGYPKPDIRWTDETGNVLPSEVTTINVPYDHRAILSIVEVKNNMSFTCEASNTNGDISQKIKVQIENILKIIDKPKDTSIKYMESDKIYCKVSGYRSAEITWKKNDNAIKDDDNFEIIEGSEVLNVKQMLPHMVGKYTCLAQNGIDSVEMEFELQISGTAPKTYLDNPLHIDAEYDKPLTLTCRATGYPKPIIKWFDNTTSEELLSSATAPAEASKYEYQRQLNVERIYKNVNYTCKATNSLGEDSITASVETVAYFKIVEPPKDTTIEYTKEGKVFCRVEAKPEAEIKWLHKNKPLSNGAHYHISADNTSLTISNMQPGLSGHYSCLVSNKNNLTDLVIKIGISGLLKPVIDKTMRSLSVLEGSSTDINCKIIQGIPEPTITWMFRAEDEKKFTNIKGVKNSIHLDNISKDQTGGYRCIAKNAKTKDSHTVYLTVEYPPTIEKPKNRINAEDGKSVNLQCLTNAVPAPQVTWYLNDVLIEKGKEYKIYSDNSLSFKASPAKSGIFNCTATNKHGSKSITTQVDYFVPVNFEQPLETTIETSVGKDENLVCVADGFPIPTIQWLFFSSYAKPNAPPKVLKTAVSPDTLELRSLRLTQDGDYTCVASNNMPSEKNMTYTVRVFGKPMIINTPRTKNIRAVIGDKLVRIPCEAIGRPKPDITWINEKGFNIAAGTLYNDVDKDGALIIKNIDEGGIVTCVADNSLGSDRKSFTVVTQKYPKPSNPVSEHKLKVNEPAEIICPLPNTKIDSVRWYKGDTLMNTSEENQLLKFEKVSPLDGGIYTCRVSTFTGPAQSVSVQIIPVE